MSERIFKFEDVIFDTGPLPLLFNYNGKDFYLLLKNC